MKFSHLVLSLKGINMKEQILICYNVYHIGTGSDLEVKYVAIVPHYT